jgi:hypothetical protein
MDTQAIIAGIRINQVFVERVNLFSDAALKD